MGFICSKQIIKFQSPKNKAFLLKKMVGRKDMLAGLYFEASKIVNVLVLRRNRSKDQDFKAISEGYKVKKKQKL